MKKDTKNALLQRMEYGAYRMVAGLVRRASDESLARWGSRLGRLSARLLRKRNRLAMRNLQETFPDRSEAELRQILRACWSHFGRELLLFLQIQSLDLNEIAERCPFVNQEVMDQARAKGKGILLLSGHFGGWEIGSLAIMSLVDRVTAVARPMDNKFLERDLATAREQTGVQIVDRRKAARSLMKALTGNRVVILLPDQAVQPREGILVPFLGRNAWTTAAPAKLAARSGATIVFAFCMPAGTRHIIEFVEAIAVSELSEAEREPAALTARINEVLSRRIRERPDLYWWMHNRWKGVPAP